MKRGRGLGRGLDSLIPGAGEAGAMILQLPVEQIHVGPNQPREHFDEDAVSELAESIRLHGILQPLVVSEAAEGYLLIAGERRLRAARILGLEQVPAVVRQDSGQASERLVLSLIENLQRENLNPLEEARGLNRLTEELGLTHEQIADRLGKQRATVTNSLRLLSVAPALQSALASNLISAGHARALAGLGEKELQETGLRKLLADNLSVRQTERWVAEFKRPSGLRPSARPRPMEALAAELTLMLSTKVTITGGRSRGRLIVEYGSAAKLAELKRRLFSDAESG